MPWPNYSTAPGVGSSPPDFSQRSTTNLNPGNSSGYWYNPFAWLPGGWSSGLSTNYIVNRGTGQSIVGATASSVADPMVDGIKGLKEFVEELKQFFAGLFKTLKWIWIPLLAVLVFFMLKRK